MAKIVPAVFKCVLGLVGVACGAFTAASFGLGLGIYLESASSGRDMSEVVSAWCKEVY